MNRVFVSYTQKDSEIVEMIGRAYKALGIAFLCDVEILRSGEEWNPALLELIGAQVSSNSIGRKQQRAQCMSSKNGAMPWHKAKRSSFVLSTGKTYARASPRTLESSLCFLSSR